jgi:alpha-N-arabinofuranosidase
MEALLSIDPTSGIGAVNRAVLGNNALAYLHFNPELSAQGAGMWDPKSGEPVPAMTRLARDIGLPTLRWPGGCAVHEYDWKLAVGPIAKRPQQAFGLPEFLRLAHEIGAVPVITVADYWGEPKDAADLVEYLNGPAGKNANGGVDWSAVRAADGHPEPYGVVWFEYGNETSHGTHPAGTQPTGNSRRYGADEYARRYLAYRAAMKAVDPGIRLGAVLDNDTQPSLSPWTRTVVRETAHSADFYIEHAYLPQYTRADGAPDASDLFRLAFAGPPQLRAVLSALGDFIRESAGHPIPLAVTEYNASFVQDKPTPYRLSLGAAIEVADMVQVLLDPSLNVATAQYWHFANEYWGMVKGFHAPYTLRPAYYVFQLYHDHLGDTLVRTRVKSPTFQEPGGFGVVPAHGDGSVFQIMGSSVALDGKWSIEPSNGAKAEKLPDGGLKVSISTRNDLDYYQSGVTIPVRASTGYRVTAEIRTKGLSGRGVQLQVGDARGWATTKSAALSDMVSGDNWSEASVDYVTLPDARAVQIVARRRAGTPEPGQFEVRNLRVQRFQPFVLPEIRYIDAIATRKGRRVSAFIVNRRVDGPVRLRIDAAGAQDARGWTLAGPSIDATNEARPDNVKVGALEVHLQNDTLSAMLPAHSFSVIEFDAASANAARLPR